MIIENTNLLFRVPPRGSGGREEGREGERGEGEGWKREGGSERWRDGERERGWGKREGKIAGKREMGGLKEWYIVLKREREEEVGHGNRCK